ncbi:MAG: uroporphyrinogen decarboxylase [Anaerolineales bacterium]|nr:uroporphyrinogen decarboxylase [Chloroflexota bacterium]MBL7164764.1 uroporphyrinogen decarboxylase [Anaerolineales bacterium]
MSTLTHRQRLEICLSGEKPDRPPVALWRHFPVDDQTPEGLASATLNFQRLYDFDFVKVTPASSFCIKDWGSRDDWRGATEGTRAYTHRVIQQPEDWTRLQALDPARGSLGDQLKCLSLLEAELSPNTPIIQTIFSPMAQAKNLVGGEQLLVHLRRAPDAVHEGLKIIAETTQRFVEAALDTGIAGVFYAIQHAQYGLLSEGEFAEFCRPYDLQVLAAAKPAWFNMLHLHGQDVMFDQVLDFPVQVINWHDRETEPSLAEALTRFPGVLCGGLRRNETMVLGTPESVTAEAADAIQATGGQRFILGTGCVTPTIAPHGNILAARQSVGLDG